MMSAAAEDPSQTAVALEENQETIGAVCEWDLSRWENIHPLTVDLWRMILQRLPADALARAACVCRIWYSIAGDPVVLSNSFREAWKLDQVVGRPLSTSFWSEANLGRFAISHKVNRWDTVTSLAVKYQVHVTEIKRLNNMISDHGIHSRERLLIPVPQAEFLHGKACYIEVDPYAKREVAVLYLDDDSPIEAYQSKSEKYERRLFESMKKSLNVDDSTVHYYLSLADGDIKQAFCQYNEDLRWERSRNFPML